MANWRFYLNNIEVEEPVGWDGIEFTAKRMESYGIDQPFSTEIMFYGIGAKIISDLYNEKFINAEISIRIETNDIIDNLPFVFNGFLNLAVYEETNTCDTDGWAVKVGILDDNFRENFKARIDVDVDISALTDLNGSAISALTYDSVLLHTQELSLAAKATVVKEVSDFIATTGPCANAFVSVMPFFWSNSDFKENFGTTFDPKGFRPYDDCDLNDNNKPFFVNNGTEERTFVLSGCGKLGINPSFVVGTGSDPTYQIRLIKWPVGNYPARTTTALYSSPPIPILAETIVSYDFTQTVVVPVNHAFNLIVQYGPVTGFTDLETTLRYLPDSTFQDTIKLSERNSDSPASLSDVLLIENLFRRLIYIYTGEPDSLRSSVFGKTENGCFWNFAITNGLKIRNALPPALLNTCFPENPEAAETYHIKTSFKKLFEGLNNIFCLGWGYEWTGSKWVIRLEQRDFFYEETVGLIIQNPDEIIQTAMTDSLVNHIQVGYEDDWKNIQLSGAYSINTYRDYFIANRAMEKGSTSKLELLSKIIAEGNAIEFSRRMQFYVTDSATSDRPNDYGLFIIWLNKNEITINVEENPEYKLPTATGNQTFQSGTISISSTLIAASGTDAPSALYNIFITPARNAFRWWKVLSMYTYGMQNPIMQFRAGEYITDYQSTIGNIVEPESCQEIIGQLSENTNIQSDLIQANLATTLFKPIEIKFKFPQSFCEFYNISDNRSYNRIKVKMGAKTISGYIQQIANKPEEGGGGVTEFILLASIISEAQNRGAYSNGYSNAYS